MTQQWFDSKEAQETMKMIERVLKISDDSHNILTPLALCDEVVNKIPSLDGQILVVSNLEFVYTMKKKGVDVERIHFATPCQIKAKVAGNILPKANIYKYDNVITKEDVGDMKFDVVVGNPPYQAADNKNTKILWPKFLNHGFDMCTDGGYVSMITPRTWTTNSLYDNIFLKHRPIFINIDECEKYFPGVGSSFSYYVIQNNKSSGVVTITNKNGTTTLKQMPSVGLGNSNPIALSIMSKTIENRQKFKMITSSGYNTMKFSKNDPTVSWVKTQQHKYKVLHKNLKKTGPVYFYSNLLDTKIYNIPRVVISIWVNNYKDMTVETKLLTCEQFRHFPTNTIQEAQNLRKVLLSPLYNFIAKSLVSGGSFTNKSMSQFPAVDLSRSWTDEELYEHFNLTKEEIQLIEDTVK